MVDGEPHPVDAAERAVPGQTVPGIGYHVLAVVQRILRQTLEIAVLPRDRALFQLLATRQESSIYRSLC